MQMHERIRRYLSCLLAIAAVSATCAAAEDVEPLPLDVVTGIQTHNGRSPIDLSPDGEWIAHTYSGAETVSRDAGLYSASGFPLAEGNARMRAAITHTRSGEMVHLGDGDSASWAAAWSPDGRRVAFYSDAGGEAGLWIWDRAQGRSRRVPGLVVRPLFGFETVRWAPDGRRLLVKALPAGMTVAEANGAQPSGPERDRRFPPAAAGEASVFVLTSEPPAPARMPPSGSSAGGQAPAAAGRRIDPMSAELAVVDIEDGSVERIGAYAQIRDYAFSPDRRHVAYTVMTGIEPNSQQPLFDLMLHSFADGGSSVLAGQVRLAYGIEWNWSPDGTRLAYIESGQRGAGDIVVLPVSGDGEARLEGGESGGFDTGHGILAPWWHAGGEHLYAVGRDGRLWRATPASGDVAPVAGIEGQRITELVAARRQHTAWSAGGDGRLWVMARAEGAAQSGIYSIDPATGEARAELVDDERRYTTYFNLDANAATGEIAYVASDQQRMFDVWLFDTATGQARQATRLNPELQRYRLGQARLIEWNDARGRTLRGSLLLPPGYRPGVRLPLVVWVYGGSNGSEYIDAFGLRGDIETFNMHVLATRGYAVLYPDVPVDVGSPAQDVLDAVVPAVEAAVAQGYADPDRVAAMGQSYGAYNVLSLLGRTSIFRAAVLSGLVTHPDLVAGYLEMRPDGSAAGIGYYEEGQGAMGGSPWEFPERYRENSPIFDFDRIHAPVLIGRGDKDGTPHAADAVFVALRRLGGQVEYRLYEDESHVIQHRANVIDFWDRRLEFLGEHLDAATGR